MGMSQLGFHVAGILMTVLVALCAVSAIAAVTVVDGVAGLPAGALAAVATFQALRVPFGRTAVRVLDR
jgi:UDP-N-acetylmuramyl pentapeptide phosphotransferase/UDP-N-acetylglucosamine-1-phosphate transferase